MNSVSSKLPDGKTNRLLVAPFALLRLKTSVHYKKLRGKMSTLFNHIPFLKLEISQVHLAKRGLK